MKFNQKSLSSSDVLHGDQHAVYLTYTFYLKLLIFSRHFLKLQSTVLLSMFVGKTINLNILPFRLLKSISYKAPIIKSKPKSLSFETVLFLDTFPLKLFHQSDTKTQNSFVQFSLFRSTIWSSMQQKYSFEKKIVFSFLSNSSNDSPASDSRHFFLRLGLFF